MPLYPRPKWPGTAATASILSLFVAGTLCAQQPTSAVVPIPAAVNLRLWKMMTLMGATPTMVPYKDVKGAFEDGKIDCAENNLPSFISAGHYKHAKYFFQTNHVVTPEALVVALSAWKKLSAADQVAVRAAGQASALHMRQLWNKEVEEARAVAIKAGIVFDRPIEYGAYVSRMKPMHQKYWRDASTRDELLTILAN